MTDEVLERPAASPTLPAPAPQTAAAEKALTIEQTIRAQFAALEPTMTALAARHSNIAWDVTTPKGLSDAKAARHELRESGRFFLNRSLDAKKREVNDAKKILESETARLVAIVKPVEDEIDAIIVARENELAAEKAERERVAAERRARFEAEIAKITGMVARCAGISAERIANGIRLVEDMTFGEDWAEFAAAAAKAQAETLAAMRRLHAEALEAEARAAREAALEVERQELARQAEAQRQERARLDAQAEELRRARAELEAARTRAEPPAPSASAAAAEPAQAEAAAATSPAPVAPVHTAELAPEHPPITAAAPAPIEPAPTAAPASPVVATERATLTLTQINERLNGPKLDAACLAKLGVPQVDSKGPAVRIDAEDWSLLKAALVAHIEALA